MGRLGPWTLGWPNPFDDCCRSNWPSWVGSLSLWIELLYVTLCFYIPVRKDYGNFDWVYRECLPYDSIRYLHFLITMDIVKCKFCFIIMEYWSCTLLPNLTFNLIARGFHRTFATVAACQQRMLTPPDTWFCPTLGLASSNAETNISWTCLVSGLLSFEHPSVLLFLLVSTCIDVSDSCWQSLSLV